MDRKIVRARGIRGLLWDCVSYICLSKPYLNNDNINRRKKTKLFLIYHSPKWDREKIEVPGMLIWHKKVVLMPPNHEKSLSFLPMSGPPFPNAHLIHLEDKTFSNEYSGDWDYPLFLVVGSVTHGWPGTFQVSESWEKQAPVAAEGEKGLAPLPIWNPDKSKLTLQWKLNHHSPFLTICDQQNYCMGRGRAERVPDLSWGVKSIIVIY